MSTPERGQTMDFIRHLSDASSAGNSTQLRNVQYADVEQALIRVGLLERPHIEEPTNWLACVVDEAGVRWARESEADYPWITEQGERTDNWKNLGPTVVRVLSEGIS